MRVLHVQRAKGIGGSERHLATLLPALSDSGVDVCLTVLEVGDGASFGKLMRDRGVTVNSIPAPSDLSVAVPVQLVRSVRRLRPDIVHTHLAHADIYGQLAARLTGVPGVSTLHSVHGFYTKGLFSRPLRWAVGSASRVVGISQHVANYATTAGLVSSSRMRVVPYGVDPERWVVSLGDRVKARQRWGFDSRDVVIGTASRLIPGKGHELLLSALAHVIAESPSLRLVVAGTGPLMDSLKAQVADAGLADAVHFPGFVHEVRELLAACDVFALPTRQELDEGFGLAVLEAMAAGLPVIASSVGAMPDLVAEGGGVLVRGDDVEEWERLLRTYVLDPNWRKAAGAAAQHTAHSTYSTATMVRLTQQVYEEAL